MLGELLYSLADQISAFNVFRYVSVRTAAAAATAIVLSLGLGPLVIARLSRLRVGERIRADGPAHHHKAGTPTMGGVLIVGAVFVSTLLWADLGNVLVWVALAAMAGFGTLGFLDDWKKLRRADGIGLSVRQKFGAQLLLGIGVGGFLLWYSAGGEFTTRVVFPFWKEFQPELAFLIVPAAMLVLVASSNAVNLTDGLDGLAAGCVLVAAAVYTALTYLAGHAEFSEYLDILYVPGASEVTIFGAAITGAALGFLWFNAHPARVFMGDVGSLALGAGIGMQAILIRQEMLLVIVGGVFVLEAASVILQVACFQAHRAAPLPDGPAPSSLRARGLGRDPGERPFLDPGGAVRARDPDDPEAAVTDDRIPGPGSEPDFGVGSGHHPGAGCARARGGGQRAGGGRATSTAAGGGCWVADQRPGIRRLGSAAPGRSASGSTAADIRNRCSPAWRSWFRAPGCRGAPTSCRPPAANASRSGENWNSGTGRSASRGTGSQRWTGTKGKSSVVTLLGAAFDASGIPAAVCGNTGVPLTALAGTLAEDAWAVVEASSFQLATIHRFRARVAVLLPVGEDHLDWHPDLDDYRRCKARLGENQTASDWVVFDGADPVAGKIATAAAHRTGADLLPFGGAPGAHDPEVVFEAGRIVRRDGSETRVLGRLSALRLSGRHNQRNLAAAAAAASVLGVGPEAIEAAASGFAGLPHALREAGTVAGVRCVNDSRATNLEATRAALRTLGDAGGRIRLILGGILKGGRFSDLEDALEAVDGIHAIGTTRNRIAAEIRSVPVELHDGLDGAVEAAIRRSRPGGIVLLSPGCSSFDQFDNYAHRGRRFEARGAGNWRPAPASRPFPGGHREAKTHGARPAALRPDPGAPRLRPHHALQRLRHRGGCEQPQPLLLPRPPGRLGRARLPRDDRGGAFRLPAAEPSGGRLDRLRRGHRGALRGAPVPRDQQRAPLGLGRRLQRPALRGRADRPRGGARPPARGAARGLGPDAGAAARLHRALRRAHLPAARPRHRDAAGAHRGGGDLSWAERGSRISR